ncbi:hypothetical protein C8F01DRAFT_1075388 [Mycena amicta]|nr:hypothetical protein C8F01DRAFT_1075388 [Mycena amicta]
MVHTCIGSGGERRVRGLYTQQLTQLRAKIKKTKIGPLPARHQNIYTLSKLLVDGSNCNVTVELCARVALMREVFMQCYNTDGNLWNKIDSYLEAIRKKAAGDAHKIARAFRMILQDDRNNHGTDDYEIIDDAGALVQQEVASVIDASTMDTATSVPVADADADADADEA